MPKDKKDNPCTDQTPYPFNFSTLREECHDPTLGKDIKWLIDSDDEYIVYIDQDDYVEWTMNSNTLLADAGDLLTRVGTLEAVEDEHLSQYQRETYKRLIGEGVARLFERNRSASTAALDAAEKWITARNQEAARLWYLEGATVSLILVSIGFAVALWEFGFDASLHGRPVVGTAAWLAALGAWLSVLQRSGQTALDLAAGARVQRIEGLVRVASGAVGGAFVALLLRSGYILPSAQLNAGLFLAICLVAGLSERLVNSLAGSVEGSTSFSLKPSPSPIPKPNVLVDPNPPDQGGQALPAAPKKPLTKDSAVWHEPTQPPA